MCIHDHRLLWSNGHGDRVRFHQYLTSRVLALHLNCVFARLDQVVESVQYKTSINEPLWWNCSASGPAGSAYELFRLGHRSSSEPAENVRLGCDLTLGVLHFNPETIHICLRGACADHGNRLVRRIFKANPYHDLGSRFEGVMHGADAYGKRLRRIGCSDCITNYQHCRTSGTED